MMISQRLIQTIQDLASANLELPIEASFEDELLLYCFRRVVEKVQDPKTEVDFDSLDPAEGWNIGDERGELLFVPTCEIKLDKTALQSYFSAMLDTINNSDEDLAIALTTTFVDQAIGCGEHNQIEALLTHSNKTISSTALRKMHTNTLQSSDDRVQLLLKAIWKRNPTIKRNHQDQIRKEGLVLFKFR